MKQPLKILRTAIFAFVIVFAVTFVFLLIEGKSIIAAQLAKMTHKKVSIGYVGLTLLFNIEGKNLEIPGVTKIVYASIAPSIPGLLSGNIVLNDLKLVKPEFTYVRTSPKTNAGSFPAGVTGENTVLAQQPKVNPQPKSLTSKTKYLRLIIKRLSVKDAKIDFFDRTLPDDGIKITFKNINFDLTNLYIYPRSVVTRFKLDASIPWLEGQEEGRIEAKGWVNLFKKDMDATLKISGIDGVYLYPYYAQWVSLEKTRIQSAKLSLNSDIKSVDNKLSAVCHLELTDIVFKTRPEEEMDKSEKIATAVLGIFKALNQGQIIFNFTIKTRMTSPEFNFGYIKTAFEDQLREGMKYSHVDYSAIVRVPAKRVGRTATDLSKALYNGTFGLAKVFKDTLKVAFQKEEE